MVICIKLVQRARDELYLRDQAGLCVKVMHCGGAREESYFWRGNYHIIELSHDWNIFYDQTLHQRAIACVQYADSWFNTG